MSILRKNSTHSSNTRGITRPRFLRLLVRGLLGKLVEVSNKTGVSHLRAKISNSADMLTRLFRQNQKRIIKSACALQVVIVCFTFDRQCFHEIREQILHMGAWVHLNHPRAFVSVG